MIEIRQFSMNPGIAVILQASVHNVGMLCGVIFAP